VRECTGPSARKEREPQDDGVGKKRGPKDDDDSVRQKTQEHSCGLISHCYILDVSCDVPLVAKRVLHSGIAVAVGLIGRLLE